MERSSFRRCPACTIRSSIRAPRALVFERLDSLEWNDDNPLLKGGYVYNMVLQHEYQHNETILQTLQLKKGEPYEPPLSITFPRRPVSAGGMVSFPGGRVTIGTQDRSAAYDNERP